MKRVIVVHGWDGKPTDGWYPWIKKELQERGFEVIVPAMPDPVNPTYNKWFSHLAKIVGQVSENDYFIGHSLGCITILRFLENLDEGEKIGGVVLVAGFGHDLEYPSYKGELSSFFARPVDWDKIKSHCPKFVAIHSDNDDWVPIKHNQLFVEKLGARGIIEHNKYHFSGNDKIPTTELPSVLQAVLEISVDNTVRTLI